jgi:hypothetical protein
MNLFITLKLINEHNGHKIHVRGPTTAEGVAFVQKETVWSPSSGGMDGVSRVLYLE